MNPGRHSALRFLSILVPIYNEEENIPSLVERLVAVGATLDKRVEIILVDDGSRDRSADLQGSDNQFRQMGCLRAACR